MYILNLLIDQNYYLEIVLDDEFININLIKSKNSVDYSFLMSNVISKLLSSS